MSIPDGGIWYRRVSIPRWNGGAADAGPVMRGGTCVDLEEVDCDDNDPCTLDECEPASAICRYAPATRDNDGDGFNGPRVGTKPAEPGSCGDDCDDTSELAFPGNLPHSYQNADALLAARGVSVVVYAKAGA